MRPDSRKQASPPITAQTTDSKRRVLAMSGAAMGMLALFNLAARMTHPQTTEPKPYGQFTAPQIQNRSAELCRVIAPGATRVTFVLEPHPVPSNGGSLHRLWKVDGVDAGRDAVANFDWDADTGDLVLVSLNWPPVSARETTPVSGEEAARAARQWVERLGFGPKGTDWKMVGMPRKGVWSWVVRWRAGDRTVLVTMDRCGYLSYARGWQTLPGRSLLTRGPAPDEVPDAAPDA